MNEPPQKLSKKKKKMLRKNRRIQEMSSKDSIHSKTKDFDEILLQQNRRPIKCLKVLFNFININPDRMVTDSSLIVVCVLFALYSCWEEPQTPLYDILFPFIPKKRIKSSKATIPNNGKSPSSPAQGENSKIQKLVTTNNCESKVTIIFSDSILLRF